MTEEAEAPTATLDDILKVDLSTLTIGEVEEIEDRTGLPIDALGGDGKKGTLMRSLVYVVKQREDDTFTWEDAGKVRIELSDSDAPLEGGA